VYEQLLKEDNIILFIYKNNLVICISILLMPRKYTREQEIELSWIT